ncbi:MAG: hypothetical protein DLM70_04235 [Chloroflexi bacterium]|nr:MAG: hypothetical protein DLM70_04235 [Chloroflexota bacterium]
MYAKFVAGNPMAQAPGANPHYLSETDALTHARGGDVAAPARALLPYRDAASLNEALAANGVVHPDRKVWVVTVHGDVMTPGSLTTRPTVVHAFSMIIDAESGIVTNWCYGCEAVK